MVDLREKRFGKDGKTLAQLSEDELQEELRTRRRLRIEQRAIDSAPAKTLAKYYANLELRPGATLEDVQRAYETLMRKYDPDKHANDPQKHRVATELAASLTAAHRALVDELTRREGSPSRGA